MRILIGGDVVPTEGSRALFEAGDAAALFGKTMDLAKRADRVIVNLECALTDSEIPLRKIGPNLKGAPACAKTLKAFGVTDAALANNHMFDYGVKGLRDTMAALDAVGIRYTGIGENDTASRKPLFLDDGKTKIGILNVCEHEYSYALPDRIGANPYDPYLTMQDIREAKKQADYVIVLYHGGKEQCRYPSPRLYRACHEMVRCGADVVLTQHSHCIGCCEQFEGGHILHGQGNFCFCGHSQLEGWNEGLLVELDTAGGLKIAFHPFRNGETCVELSEGAEREEILDGFRKRSEELQNGKWLDGWRTFCEAKREPYTKVLRNLREMDENERALQKFAHYLDCEAHRDVWLELFPTWNRANEK